MNRSFLPWMGVASLAIACSGTPAPPPSAPETSSSTTTTTTTTTSTTAPSTTASATTAPSTSGSATASTAPAWTEMTHEQKLDFMKKVFMPKMKAEFLAFDAKTYEKMNCETCHGDGAKAGTFDMPNPKIHKLKVDPGFKTEMGKHPEATKFMMEKVVVDARELLGLSPYDPKTHEGFGCLGCHTEKK